MAWHEKRQPTPFDELPIHGLCFLDGDMLNRRFRQEWAAGMKYSVIAFPSGFTFPLFEVSPASGIEALLHLFGEMDLAYRATRDDAFELANIIALMVGYGVRRRGDDQLDVWNGESGEQFTITYDNTDRRIVNIERLTEPVERPVHPGHMLMNEEVAKTLPPLYSNEEIGLAALAPVKYFMPDGNWTWYASEGSPIDEDGYFDTCKEKVDYLFFGLVIGWEIELGYFSLSELQSVRGALGLPIERDLYYEPKTLQDLKRMAQESKL